jgi:HEAT repeat protein
MSEVKVNDLDRTDLNPSADGNSPPSPCDEGAGRGEIVENRHPPRPSPPSEGGEGEVAQGAAAKGGAPGRHRWKRLLIALCATTVLLFVLRKFLDPQPTYQGRTVESWLAQVFDPNGNQSEAIMALKAMGRVAVPYEIKALGRHDSKWRRKLKAIRRKAQAFVAGMLPDPVHPDALRVAALLVLLNNPHTGEFAPQIVRLLDDSDANVRLCAAEVVSHTARSLDQSAISAICRALKDPGPRVRLDAASTLGWMGVMAHIAVPDLERALEDADSKVRSSAAKAIMRIRGTNLADGPVKQRLNQIEFEVAERELSYATNR